MNFLIRLSPFFAQQNFFIHTPRNNDREPDARLLANCAYQTLISSFITTAPHPDRLTSQFGQFVFFRTNRIFGFLINFMRTAAAAQHCVPCANCDYLVM